MIRTATPGGSVAPFISLPRTSRAYELRRSHSVHRSFLLSLVSSLLLLACGEQGLTVVGPNEPDGPSLADAQIEMVAGDSQEAEVAAFLPEPLVVEVLDAAGAPFTSAPVE